MLVLSIILIYVNMGVIASNTYLTTFGLGTFVGAACSYIFLRMGPKLKFKKGGIWKEGMEERFEVCFSLIYNGFIIQTILVRRCNR